MRTLDVVSMPDIPARYIADITDACSTFQPAVISVILFGSVATGGFAESSDIDLIIIASDEATDGDLARLRSRLSAVETRYFPVSTLRGFLERFAQRVTANVRTFFVCTRSDILSGEPYRILGIPRAQGRFVDRIVLPSIIGSAVTVWGEELLDLVPLPAIRRWDVCKSFFGLSNQLLLILALFPVVPASTYYAMSALKRSIHSCYFCFNLAPASLNCEVDFFRERLGSHALARLLELRASYHPSFSFVASCLPALVRLHLRTLLENSFPRPIPAREIARAAFR